MSADWSFALKVGGVGFGFVFIILILLYVALSMTGKLSIKLNESKAAKKKSSASEQI